MSESLTPPRISTGRVFAISGVGGAALGGGTAATAATALLLASYGASLGVALYSTAACVVVVLCALGLRETSNVPTETLGIPVAKTRDETCERAQA